MKDALLLYAKGMAMGAADVVPGVSGGTVAFITGIYDELLRSISAVPYAIRPLLRGRVAEAWKTANGSFLVVLFAGILTSILSLARLITFLLEEHPIPVWSFFFGLILVSVHLVGKEIQRRNLSRLVSFCLGIGFAYWITVAAPVQWGSDGLSLFFAGAIAICAMILPGISGSFILVLLGLYPVVLGAVKNFDIGLMLGSLNKVWPWKETLTWRTNSSGENVPVLQQNLLPGAYGDLTGQDPQLLLAILLAVGGIVLVLGLEWFAGRRQPMTEGV